MADAAAIAVLIAGAGCGACVYRPSRGESLLWRWDEIRCAAAPASPAVLCRLRQVPAREPPVPPGLSSPRAGRCWQAGSGRSLATTSGSPVHCCRDLAQFCGYAGRSTRPRRGCGPSSRMSGSSR